MHQTAPPIAPEVRRRRTFAIISHPDAGKTTLTEKLLLYGGAIHLAGAVKSRKAQRHATSDWMEIEKQRGISVTSSVLQFEYNGHAVNILDTPGHQDFSEDTYRTLAAADSAVMLIDAAKGVEEQTKKLFRVCRQRGIPIFTFVNKLDRHGKDPFDLLAELEQVLGIRSCPINWPIGMGRDFKGVYNRRQNQVEVFDSGGSHGEKIVAADARRVDDPALDGLLGAEVAAKLREDIELLDVAGDPFDLDRIRRGELTPVYFGSAMTNFGVRPFLESFLQLAPSPAPRRTDKGPVDPESPRFSGFIFKIQANMNPQHRDRIAFLRIVSGRFERGMSVRHVRLGKEVKLSQPQQFLAAERSIVEEAYAGDIIGLFDPGIFRIGDTLCQGEPAAFEGIPRFSPEHFACVRVKDAMKHKQFQKGIEQLSEEGAIQLFRPYGREVKDPIVGVVGALQYEVLQHRLKAEYGVDIEFQRLPYQQARWVIGDGFNARDFEGLDTTVVQDRDNLPIVLFKNEWSLQRIEGKHPNLRFLATSPAEGGTSGNS